MKRISDENAARIFNCLLEAKTIINQVHEDSDEWEICMNANIAEDCYNLAESIFNSFDNIVLDNAE